MDIDKPEKEDLAGWCDWINRKTVEKALGSKPAEEGSERWSFTVTAICFLAELIDLKWFESPYRPIFKDKLRDQIPNVYSKDYPDLQKVYDQIIRLTDNATRAVFETSDEDDALNSIDDIVAFMKVIVTGKPGMRYSKRVFVGAVIIATINTYNGKGAFPLRSELSQSVKNLDIKMAPSDMNDCLEYYELNDLIRDNSKG
jgi:hypothetical protein